MLKVFVNSDIDFRRWRQFILSHPNGNVFQAKEMFDVYRETKNYTPIFIFAEDEEGEIMGVMLTVIQKEHSGLMGLFSSRAIVIGGPLTKDNDPNVLSTILEEYKRVIRGRAIYTQFRNLWSWEQFVDVFARNGFVFEEHLDIIIDLTRSEDEIWNSFSRDRRKSIKKGDNSLDVKAIDAKADFDSIYGLLKSVYDRVKLPLPDPDYFHNIISYVHGSNKLQCFGAYFNSKLVGVRLVLCYKKVVYDWYAGANDSYLEYRPNDVLVWEILKWGKANNYSFFDFGGAGKPNVPYGVRDYKLKFGGRLINPGRFQLIHKPFLYKIGLFGLRLYQTIKW